MELENQIINKTRELFFRYGIKSITMDDIANHLGMSKKTIYAAFPDKKALLERMVQDYLDFHKHDTQCQFEDSANAIEYILRASSMGVAFVETINPAFLYDMQKYYGDLWQRFEEYRHKEIRADVYNTFSRGITEGLFREDLDIDIVVSMHMQHIDMLIEPTHLKGIQKSMREVMRTMILTFLNGICTPKGIKVAQKFLEKHDPFQPK
jgi:TetR/AcrR family transcriptional regulator, cholesterol catabolism regulator